MADIGELIKDGTNAAFGIGENVPSNPQNPFSYKDIGEQANRINKAEERVYLQAGYSRPLRPQALEVILQEPDVTIVVKKRQFSSLVENYQIDKLNIEERTYLRAVKRLFYNKCRAIAAYERLTKLEKIFAKGGGQLNDWLFPQVFASVEILNQLSPGLIGGKTLSTLDTLKKVKNFSDPKYYTIWSNPSEIPYFSDIGEGTGTFEITLATNISTTVSTELGRGNASLTFENPLELMVISQQDIEQAISDVVGFTNHQFFTIVEGQLSDTINLFKSELTKSRAERGASPIIISVNPDSAGYKKIRAFIDEEGREINFSYDAGVLGLGSSVTLDQASLEGTNGLKEGKETTLFKEIITNTFTLLDSQKSRRNSIVDFNAQNDAIRRRMRLEFEDRAIIQQQDLVHIFIGSKSTTDANISRGFNFSYSRSNILNNIDSAVTDISNSIKDFATAFTNGEAGSNFFMAEKNAIAGPDFPPWLWLMMRHEFTRQSAGTHVFAGIANNVSQSYNNGKYTVNVSCADFSDFLQKGQINIKPSLDVVDSSIYDPLTPFKTDYDPSTGLLGEIPSLLDDNIALLNTGSVKYASGRKRGKIVDVNGYAETDLEILTPDSQGAQFRNQYFDPEGFVYRWKRGIGTLVLSGAPNSFGTGSLRKETSSVITNSPFSGQDVMNVLSLIITGQPYNYSSFLKAASKSGFIVSEKYLGFNSTDNYLKGLISDINKSNAIWGNFIPFKRETLSGEALQKAMRGELDATINNQKLNDLLRKRAEKYDKISELYKGAPSNPSSYTVGSNNTITVSDQILETVGNELSSGLAAEIYDLDQQINELTSTWQKSLSDVYESLASSKKGSIKVFGDSISIDNSMGLSGDNLKEQLREREEFRKKLFGITQRRLWKVKSNEDQNFFIVDDTYDKNYDIQAFEDSLGNLETFKSTYSSVFELVSNAAAILGLEIFADSQGHINVRPPAYNRIPSSVFYELLKNRKVKGIKLFPDYLESLFVNQVQGITDQIEILEEQIRLRAHLLGASSDSQVETFLGGGNGSGGPSQTFVFLTSEFDGKFQGGESIQRLLQINHPDFTEKSNRQALTQLSSLVSKPNKNLVNFDISTRVRFINTYSPSYSGYSSDRALEIVNRLKARGFNDPLARDIKNYVGKNTSQVKILELTSKLSSLVSERQYLIKLLSNAIKNLEEGTNINKDPSAAKTVLFSTFNKSLNDGKIPEIILHMIEDENVDDLGPGSGSRYIIKDSHIIDFSINENPPPFTVVEVHGSLANNRVAPPQGLEVGNGGNIMSSAFAADYDMWRLYGYKPSKSVTASYLSDPVAQCAPFAVFLLNQARKNIFNATVTVKGNEYIQAGEVYYLECRDLLMYAESVDHRFSFSGDFTTTLKCTYVRKPGEFIPTMLDVIGKGLYTNRNSANLVKNVRNSNPNNDTALGALKYQIDPFADEGEANADLATGLASSFGEANRKTISSILVSTSNVLTPSKYGNKTKVELRVYYNSKAGFDSADSDLLDYAEAIKELLISPGKYVSAAEFGFETVDDQTEPTLNSDNIEIKSIDLGTLTGEQIIYPSSHAWNLARGMFISSDYVSESSNLAYAEKLKENLFKAVIDVWAVSTPNTDTGQETSNSKNDPNSQAAIEDRKKFVANFNKKLGF